MTGEDRRNAVAPNQAARQAEERCAEPFKAFRPSPSETTGGSGPVKPEGDETKIQNGGKVMRGKKGFTLLELIIAVSLIMGVFVCSWVIVHFTGKFW